jgi:hypothetical protein
MESPGICRGFFAEGRWATSEDYDVFQQRNHAKDDHDDTRDLFGATVERQQVDQIENKDNNEKRNQRTHKHRDSPEMS